HDDLVSTVCFVSDGMRVVSGSNDSTLRLWDVENSKSIVKMAGHRQPVCSAAVSLDGRTLVSGSWDWTLRVWELPSGRALRILDGHLGAVRGVGLDADGRQGVSVSEDGSLRQWLFDWAIEARAEADWDEGARIFVTSMAAAVRRRGGGKAVRPGEEDMDELMQTLSQSGYGWLRKSGVEAELLKALAPG
ncbi:MAG TPA: protein kinase, partial [Candidatus Xenobia bacterium]